MSTQSCLTSKALRPSNAWFLFSSKLNSIYQIDIGYKNSRGKFGGYSSSPQNEVNKLPWGSPNRCEFVLKRSKEDNLVRKFKFRNVKQESASFDMVIFNMKIGGHESEFSNKVNSMCIQQKEKLLALYLTLVSHSESFVHHKVSIHDEMGFQIDGSGPTLSDLSELGGSIHDYQDFIRIVKDSALDVNNGSDVFAEMAKKRTVKQTKRISNTGDEPSLKKSKTAIVNDNERIELDDSCGLEKSYLSSFVGTCRIPLDNISVPAELKDLVSESRVENIISSMKNRYDPTMTVLVVAPVDDSKQPDLASDKVTGQKFVVVQKIHTLTAFKKLNQKGDFIKLKGHAKGTVWCYVLNTNSSALIHYGNLRGNEIENNFPRKTHPQDILHVYESLLTSGKTQLESLKVIDRICKLSKMGIVESASIRKFCNFSESGLSCLMNLISKMEVHETLDYKTAPANSKRFEKLKMTNKVFNLLSKITESYLVKNASKVLSKQISLKCLAEEYQVEMNVEKVYSVLSRMTGFKSKNQLHVDYPGMFTSDIMRKYVGAEMDGKFIKLCFIKNRLLYYHKFFKLSNLN